MLKTTYLTRGAVIALVVLPGLLAQDARGIVEEAQKRGRSNSERYQGTLQVIGGEDRIATKSWTFEQMGSAGSSKALVRFTAPPEVRGVALLIVGHSDRAAEMWMWRPAIGRDQRIAFQDRSTRFFGTDFSFEDLEERDPAQFDFSMLGQDNGAWKIDSKPRQASQYTHSILWIRKDNYTLTRVEAYDRNGLVRTIEYRDFQQTAGVWAAHTVEVTDVTRKSRTVLKLEKLELNLPLKEDDFTLQALRRAS
jgi:hypothetical protein